MTQLFKDDGTGDLQEVGLFDLCEWWIETYPPDIMGLYLSKSLHCEMRRIERSSEHSIFKDLTS